jgi:hypothetical protein
MLHSDTASLKNIIIHYAGSKNNQEGFQLSEEALQLDEDFLKILQEAFLARFRTNEEYHSFTHPSSLQFNEVYQYAKQLFTNSDAFQEVSIAIARHLYEQSVHPKVKGGELYISYFEGLSVESKMCKAIGIFKTEHKSLFLDAQQQQKQVQLTMREGVELTKIDKGCLIININEDAGYDVLIFDNQNRGEEAQYWKEKFLGLTPQKTEFHHTQHLLNLTRQFITGPLEEELKLGKPEQVELLHKSLAYFKSRDSFDIDEFQNEVFQQEEMIDSFRRYGSQYIASNDYDIAAQFDISPDAVKKQSRIFKSVVKLDKNFHIYIHGRTDLIEKGVDTDGRKYYKIYYQEEG